MRRKTNLVKTKVNRSQYVYGVIEYQKQSVQNLIQGLQKYSRKQNFPDGILSYQQEQDRTANQAHLAPRFSPVFACPQKVMVGLQILAYF